MKKAVKFYLLIIFLCALAALCIVFVTDLITVKALGTIDMMGNKYIRDAVEKTTGKKIDDKTVEKIKKTYKESEKKKHISFSNNSE